MKKILVVLLCLALMVPSFAQSRNSGGIFNDLDNDHWAYSSILQMIQNGILSGYPDGEFKPNNDVSRGEFAKMMVLALDLPLDENAKSTFSDLAQGNWVVPYVETAKRYLTGYSSGGTYRFKPDEEAVREDMAVALVKALNYDLASEDSITAFSDWESISPNLRRYVATAYEKGIMKGSFDKYGKRLFKAQSPITRAEAAVLLMNVITEEKITFDDVKIPMEGDLSLYGSVSKGKLNLEWLVSDTLGLQGYKVVASEDDATPSYPDNGYMLYIADTKQQNVQLEAGALNHDGDFSALDPGKTYYFAITALYESGNKTSNVIRLTVPETATTRTVPTVSGNVLADGSIQIKWDRIISEGFSGYKVVASKSNNGPSYPNDGYYKYITSASTTSVTIKPGDGYNGGDIGKFQAGGTYYFTITALYSNGSETGNVIRLTFGEGSSETTENQAVKLTYEIKDGKLYLNWNSISSEHFSGYKVVASTTDSTPQYPDNGYYRFITDPSESEVILKDGLSYVNGNFESFTSGQAYYIAITTLYDNGSKTSNVIRVTLP